MRVARVMAHVSDWRRGSRIDPDSNAMRANQARGKAQRGSPPAASGTANTLNGNVGVCPFFAASNT